ncbi:MAG: hypothetical protein FWC50_10690 [Planctomycetaceae bacterium]|nr:hypothetical protein [Planctomycetaceae bacterium]
MTCRFRAYTLLEVIISLVILLAILTIVGMAIDAHVNNLAIGRMQVEEAQVARSLLEKIARDIRAVVLDPEVKKTSDSSNGSGDSETASGAFQSTDTSQSTTSSATSSETDSTSDSYDYEHEIIGTKKGIYGGIDWLQIDTHRMIAGERFAYNDSNNYYEDVKNQEEISQLDSPNIGQKTVLYYLGSDTGTPDADAEFQRRKEVVTAAPPPRDQGLLQSPLKYGLYYREMNRQITKYAVDSALDSATDMSNRDEQFVPEVDRLEFHYYVRNTTGSANGDSSTISNSSTGSETGSVDASNRTESTTVVAATGEDGMWLDDWDMDAEGGKLPLAVQIVVSIRRKDYKPTMIRSLLATEDETKRVATYSLIVPLSAELIDTTETDSSSGTDGSATTGESGTQSAQ